MKLKFVAAAASLTLILPAYLSGYQSSAPINDAALSEIVTDIATREKITGMVTMVIVNHETVARAAFGIRNAIHPEIALSIDDKMHLGSCTKAITATLTGLLVDQGKLSWDDTIAGRLPQIADRIAPEYRDVSLTQLLHHRGGVIANGAAWRNGGAGTVENRLEIIAIGLAKFPEGMRIGRYHYSNLGYAIVGAMIEAAAGDEYEKLVQAMIFDPIDMHSAGFGPPDVNKSFEQPWGHFQQGDKFVPMDFDNPPSMSPAGRAHANLVDWAKFIAVHMPQPTDGQRPFLSAETLEFLHTLPNDSNSGPNDRPYAGGWLVSNPGSDALELQHEGSNKFWLTTAIVQPRKGNAILVATNHPLELSQKANHQVVTRVRALIR